MRILFVGTFLASLAHYMPIFASLLTTEGERVLWADVLLNSIQYSIKLFTFGGDIMWIADKNLTNFGLFIGSVFYLVAPLFTVSFILSFFNNLTSRIKYFLHFYCHAHVFTELNEKSLALANDIAKSRTFKWKIFPSDVIVFTDVSDKKSDNADDMLERAYDMSAIIFRKGISSVKLRYRSTSRKVTIYIISDDEAKKIRQADSVMRRYDYNGMELYLFSDDIHTELMMASKSTDNIKVTRIDPIRSLIYHNLYENGQFLFKRARRIGEYNVISVVLVGLEKYGREMLKALTWLCQIKGYKLKITAFDADENAESRLKVMCPELLSDKYNGKFIEGEPYYEIKIHSGIDIHGDKIINKIKEINDATYVFVSLGSDSANLEISTKIRQISNQVDYISDGRKPDIETVIYNPSTCKMMGTTWNDICNNRSAGVTTHKNDTYDIIMTGDIDHFYSVSTLIKSELVNVAWNEHLRYEKDRHKNEPNIVKIAENSFWRYEYNYRSSLAKALHLKIKADLSINPSITNAAWDSATRKEKIQLANFEHLRWSAYMRSEGYSYSGACNTSETNHLAKLHDCLKPTQDIDDETLKYDMRFED